MSHLFRLATILALLFASLGEAAESRIRLNINPVWRFQVGPLTEPPVQAEMDDKAWEVVSLPHTHRVFPADLTDFGNEGRQMGWYRRVLTMPEAWKGKRVFLEFQGAMQVTKLWVNGTAIGEHAVSGYDSFHFDITSALKPGANQLAVCVDNTVNPDLPPDGRKTDFIQFGGLYRDVHVVVTDPLHITFPWAGKQAGISLTLPEVSEASAVIRAETQVHNAADAPRATTLITEVRDHAGALVATATDTQQVPSGGSQVFTQTLPAISQPKLWSPDQPYLYQVHSIVQQGGKEVDRVMTRYGIRWVTWDKAKGFFLNGKHLKLVGANRHQTWPFIGNAVPNGLHRRDAEDLKAMGCNWVRLAHYPHDPDFLDDLDELGIMALSEGPTWLKTGNEKWRENLALSFRSMIRRDRNHPSIIIWNACVNHSRRADASLVTAAVEEDPGRARGQHNVGTPMDFVPKRISGGGSLTIEHTGHKFDTERGARQSQNVAAAGYKQNTANREYEQARYHWEQVDAAYKVAGNYGLAVWAMHDYNTFHNARGAIARHGVLDLFRIPKFSWWWHQSELTQTQMAYVVRIDDAQACVFSNAGQVRLTQDTGSGKPLVETRKPDEGYVLKHPPFHFAVDPAAITLTAEALNGGKVVATHVWRKPGAPTRLQLRTDRSSITADGADMTRLVVTAVDQNGTEVTTSDDVVVFSITGNGQLIGESPVRLRAGSFIILARSTFEPGRMTIRAAAKGLEPATIEIVTTAPPATMDMPSALPVSQPTTKRLIVKGGGKAALQANTHEFEARTDAAPGEWVESEAIMLDDDQPLAISGGEYRIYTAPWTAAAGKGVAGDAIFVRVKSSTTPGETRTVILTVGKQEVPFQVTTRR